MWAPVTLLNIYECQFANILVYSIQHSILSDYIYVEALFDVERIVW